jgi:integrase
MRGHLVKRYKHTWNIVLELDRQRDPDTGLQGKRVQKWFTFKGTKKEAEAKLNETIHDYHRGHLVEPSKMLLGDWLDQWLETAIRPTKALRTYETYKSLIKVHLKPQLGHYPLGELRPDHLDRYYLNSALTQKTLENHHHVLNGALNAAVHYKMIRENAAARAMSKPNAGKVQHETIEAQCWDIDEVKTFLRATEAASPQQAAFYRLALETGARKGELCGFQWKDDLDWERSTIAVARQLVKRWPVPLFGPPKRKQARTIDLSADCLALLRKQKRAQAELRLLAGSAYQDHGLIFAYEQPPFGMPLSANNIGQRDYAAMIKAAGVRTITFHGLRHTAATMMLQEGIPLKVVAERLGHKKPTITLDIYAHALPSMQKEAAHKLGALLSRSNSQALAIR